MMVSNKRLIASATLLGLTILPGCWNPFQKKEVKTNAVAKSVVDDGSTVLLTINERPIVTEKSLEQDIEKEAKANPQLQFMMQYSPASVKLEMLKGKKLMGIVSEWAAVEGIREAEAYQKEEAEMLDGLRQQLDQKAFVKAHVNEPTEEDAKQYYEENKDKEPYFVEQPEGVKTRGVMFDKKAEAEAFATALRSKGAGKIDEVAKEHKATVRNLGNINKDGYVSDEKVREAVLAVKHFPRILVVAGDDNKYWVVVAEGKEDKKYRDFEEMKDQLKGMVHQKRIGEMIEKTMPQYETKYKVVVNDAHLEKEKKEKEEELQKMFANMKGSDAEGEDAAVDADDDSSEGNADANEKELAASAEK